MLTPQTPITHVIGTNVRRIRSEAGITQHELAMEMVRLGMPWNGPRVAYLEAGKDHAPTITLLVMLAVALDNLTPKGRSITPVSLLEAEGKVILAPGVSVPSAALTGVLRGGAASVLSDHCEGPPIGHSGEDETIARMRETYSRTEQRAAAELGLDKDGMLLMSAALWGRNIGEERDARAEEAGVTSRVGKARITRELIQELDLALAEEGER